MSPNISLREYIRWSDNEPSEPTSTLVLTSAENSFVDIRVLKPPRNDRPDNFAEGTNPPILHTSRLDWAFAGTSSSEVVQNADGEQVVHSTWRHWIDSYTTEPETLKDEGDMFPLENGLTLERGTMINPATGHMMDYEECWRDVEAVSTEDYGARSCIVLVLEDESRTARGMVVRVGQFCQGLLRVGDAVSLERWVWAREGGWKRMVRMGDWWVPCGAVLEGQRSAVGGEVRHGEFVWKVVEWSEF